MHRRIEKQIRHLLDKVLDDFETRPIDLDNRTLELLHTPGHAPDHVSAWLPEAGLLFANEAIGSHYAKTDTWVPPATVPRFDPDAVREAINRLETLDPDIVAFSHFGVHLDPTTVFDRMRERLATFDRRVPELYEDHDGDLAATEKAVGEELLEMDDYDDGVRAMQRRVQTRGFLMHHNLL